MVNSVYFSSDQFKNGEMDKFIHHLNELSYGKRERNTIIEFVRRLKTFSQVKEKYEDFLLYAYYLSVLYYMGKSTECFRKTQAIIVSLIGKATKEQKESNIL